MSLTKAHNRMIESAPVNIVDFGADPTGVADSASAIQAALNTGKNVFVPVGNFKIGSTLQFTRINQVFFGESGNAVNAVTTTSPASAVGVSQIFTQSAILMFSFNDKQGVQVKDVVFNGTGVATGGVDCTGAGAPPTIAFGVVLQIVGFRAINGIALDTAELVDANFYNINIQGYDDASVIKTTRGINCGATNNNFYGGRIEGCTYGVYILGSVNSFFGCTLANQGGTNVFIGGSIAQLSFNGCYIENGVMMYSTSSYVYGCVDFSNCLLHTENTSTLLDLTNAASGTQVNISGGRIMETAGSSTIFVPSGVAFNGINIGQTTPTMTGTGRIQIFSNTSNTTADAVFPEHVRVNGTAARLLSGSGTPEAAVTAPIGSVFMRTDGSTGTSFYVKESGTGNTGWVAK